MKRLISLSVAFFAFVVIMTAQENELGDNMYRATVTTNSGETAEGIITWNNDRPWQTQNAIKMFDESLLGEKRVKNKDKVLYKAKDIETLEFDDRKFYGRKVMMDACDYCSTLKALPNSALVEVIEEGTISVFRGYGSPPSVASGVSFDVIYADILDTPTYFLEKDGMKKTTNLSVVNIEKWIDDADNTYARWRDGGFGNSKRKEGKKMANFLKNSFDNDNIDLMITVVKAYNDEMN